MGRYPFMSLLNIYLERRRLTWSESTFVERERKCRYLCRVFRELKELKKIESTNPKKFTENEVYAFEYWMKEKGLDPATRKSVEDAVNKMDTYSFILEAQSWKGARYEKKIVKFHFKKPNLMRTDVLEGRRKGSTVVLNKEGKIRGGNSWGLRKTLKPTDGRLKDLRGGTFLNMSLLDKIDRLKKHVLEKGCKAAVTETEYEGTPAYYMHIDHKDPDHYMTGEDLWFDKETYMLLKNVKYEGEDKAAEATWMGFEINIPLEDDFFEI